MNLKNILKNGGMPRFTRGRVEYYDWRFEVETNSDYILSISINTKGRFKKLFESTKKTLKSKHPNIETQSFELEDTESIIIEPKFYKLLKVMIKPFWSDRAAHLYTRKTAPVTLINYEIYRAMFEKKRGEWFINIELTGVYTDA
jgi:hypothetical protein